MKQKLLNSTLYVFDVNPYIITEDASEATVIKVQEESYKGFVTMNPDLVDKLTKYNYHVICVNTPEWAPYADDEDPQESLTFGIYGSAAADAINQIQVQNADNVILESWVAGNNLEFPFQTDVEEGQHCVIECKEGTNIYQFDVTGAEYLPVQWIDQETGHQWYATYPITDSISIGINAAPPAEITVTAPYGLEIYDEETSDWVEYWASQYAPDYEEAHLVVGRTYSVEQRQGIGQDKVVVFNPECGTGSQGTVGAEFIAPETDLVITLADASPSTYTVTLDGSDIHQHVTVKMDGETVPVNIEYQDVADGTVVDVYPTGNVADYVLQYGAVWDTDHWTATVNGADLTISINYLGAGVNFNASWYSGTTPENVSQINIGNTSVTGSDLTDTSWTETVRLYPGQSQIKYFISTGLPTDMTTFKVQFDYQVDDHTEGEIHMASKETDPVTGEITYLDLYNPSAPLTNPGIWTYDNTPETGLPWIAFTLPSTNNYGNAFPDNTDMIITVSVSGS